MILRTLLAKDLRRAIRNPVPYLIHLCVPLVITALLGLAFGGSGRSNGGAPGRIRLLVVDEDDSGPTRLLRGLLNQEAASRHLDVRFLPREEAFRDVSNNLAAAALVLPEGLARRYLTGEGTVTFTLLKNPAQSFHPAIVEEAARALTTVLNAVARNLRPDLEAWKELFDGGRQPDFRVIGDQVAATGKRIEAAWKRLDPIPVVYERATPRVEGSSGGAAASRGSGFDLFAFLLPGLAAMFLLFLADVALRDLHREVETRTFDRYCTHAAGVTTFVLSKVCLTFVILAVGCLILLGGGSLIFGFRWHDPAAVMALAAGVCLFSGGITAALNAWVGGGKKADVVNTMVGMALGMAGGCAFPAQSLPIFLRDHVTPLLPPYWFVEAMRAAQFEGYRGPSWGVVALGLAALGLGFAVLAASRMRHQLSRGIRG